MVVDTGNKFWKLENGIWRVKDSFTRENNYQFEAPRKKDSSGKIIQYSTEDWFKQGKNPGGAQWNPGGGDGFKGNKAKAWTKGVVGVLTGNEQIMDAAIHGNTDDFLKSTGEGMSDTELAINLTILGAGVVGGIASSRAGVRSGHAESGNLKAMKTKYKISKAQVIEEGKKQGVDMSKVSEGKLNAFVEEWNKKEPADNVKAADTYYEKLYGEINDKIKSNNASKPEWTGGSWDRAKATEKSSFTTRWNAWKTTKAQLNIQLEKIGNKFSRIREIYNKLKAERASRLKEEGKAKAEADVKKFETENDLKPMTFMEYLVQFKNVYKKNPTEAELADFKITFNKFRVDLKNVDSAIRETATENYKSAGEADPTSTYFRMWEDIKSKNNGKIDLKAFEDQIKTESLEAFRSARASRITQFENQHGLKPMTIEEYIYKYQENNNGYRPNRAQLKKFIADYNDYRVDLNSISESTKIKIMEDYEAGGEKTPNLYEVWEVNKIKGGNFEEALLKDAAASKRAAAYTEKISKLEGIDKNGDGELTKEEVKAFNKKFDFDADGILGKEEKAAKTAEIEEKYGDLDAEERRLLEDDEVEVDLFGDDPAPPKTEPTGKAGKVAAGVAGAGAVAGAVAAAVEGSKDSPPKDNENWRDWGLPDARRRMIEVPDYFNSLLRVFKNPYYYPGNGDSNFLFYPSSNKPQVKPNPAIKNFEPPFMSESSNPFDIGGNQVPVNMEDKTFHPDITRKKVHELLLKLEGAYTDDEGENAKLISYSNAAVDVQVKIYTEATHKVVAFRGSDSSQDWINNINVASARLDQYFPFIKNSDNLIGHDGYFRSLALVYEDIKKELDGVVNFEITGHSAGSGLASIFLYVYYLDTFKLPLHAFVFGSPRVFIGDVRKYNEKVDLVRFQNSNDPATFLPSKEFSVEGLGGAVTGGLIGSLASARGGVSSTIGGTVGAFAGGVAAGKVNPQPYKHVGLGIMLFKEKNEVVDLGTMKGNDGKRVVPENYLYIPEGQDILRNPVDIEGVISKTIYQYSLGEQLRQASLTQFNKNDPTYNVLFDSYVSDNKYGIDFLNKAYGYFQVFLDAHKILLKNSYEDAIFKRVERFRRKTMSKLKYSKSAMGYLASTQRMGIAFGELTNEMLRQLGDKAFKQSTEFYKLPNIDRARYTNEGVFVEKFWAEQHEHDEPEYLEYLRKSQQMINDFFREQKANDKFVLRDTFARFIVYDTILWTGKATEALDTYSKVVGHQLGTYLRRTDELPEILYSGQNVPEIITDTAIGGGGGFDTYYRRNPHVPHRNYYDKNGNGFYLDNFNKIQPVNKILGFIFYNDPSVINQLILY